MKMTALGYISICVGILVICYIVLLIVDRHKYNKKLKSCGTYIPFSMIPKPTRIVHYCRDNLENVRYTVGDIFILDKYEYNEFKMKADPVRKYYTALSFGNIVEISEAQIDRLEQVYKIKIREDY